MDKKITTCNKFIKENWRELLVIIMSICVIILLFKCEDKKEPIVNNNTNQLDKIISKNNEIIKLNEIRIHNLRDSLINLNKAKVVIKHHYHTVYDSLLITDTSCVRSLITLYKQCNKVDSINESIISNQSNQIAEFASVVSNQKDIIDIRSYQHSVDSTNEISYKEQIKTFDKKLKIAKLGGWGKGILFGVAGFGIGGLIK